MNRSFSFLFLLIFLSLRSVAPAAPLDRDLGHGLAYHRIHQLPADLPSADAGRKQPCVLDLRYVHPDAEAVQTAAQALTAWVKSHATPRTPVLLLANAATNRALLVPLTGHDPIGSVVVIGAASPGFEPDIALRVSPDAERRAYDALENGATVDSLIVENTNKPRNDEAQLAKERLSDSQSATESVPPEDKAVSPKTPPPPIDAALQRAVQLHRTLVALKKL